ncbi:hypothetical protein ASPZODRAFT_12400 [Penicilliopsis zonata CBS 506.65]|uniref:Uncharacterized protein n=1 Tax=Penicilliopsis zonata CBS 506.65 TaxID=1073090 RepID=A0A1L9SWK6_9EURO|nr:hypothetical protein ASPZODRAFT_12400 [Penicilliopsis zonata CBS 506.65]OJJ51585.1 hypothetical protein ASPZODRAFT_12400 [Penicilliopsis zonata CBS 506.65]
MSRVQEYWLPGYGLSRHIVLGHIRFFLGPSASEQINDLAIMSREYERQEALRMAHRSNLDITSQNPAEPYINELVSVNPRGRRQPVGGECRRGR